MMGQLVGSCIEFGVAQLRLLKDERHRLRRARDLRLKELRQRRFRQRLRRLIPIHQKLLALR